MYFVMYSVFVVFILVTNFLLFLTLLYDILKPFLQTFVENGEFGQHLPNSVHFGDNPGLLMFSIVSFEVGYVLFVLAFL